MGQDKEYKPKMTKGKTKFRKASFKMVEELDISERSTLMEVTNLVSGKMVIGMEQTRITIQMES